LGVSHSHVREHPSFILAVLAFSQAARALR